MDAKFRWRRRNFNLGFGDEILGFGDEILVYGDEILVCATKNRHQNRRTTKNSTSKSTYDKKSTPQIDVRQKLKKPTPKSTYDKKSTPKFRRQNLKFRLQNLNFVSLNFVTTIGGANIDSEGTLSPRTALTSKRFLVEN